MDGLPRIDTSSPPPRKGSGTRAGGPPSAPQAKQAKQAVASKAAAADPAEEPSRPKIKTSWTDIDFLGLPIVFWLLFLAGIGAAVALAIAVLRTRG
jgi:disulfide bond formation protein DsbB